jgi:hypothetical protein
MAFCNVNGYITYIPKRIWDSVENEVLNKEGVFVQASYNINNWGDSFREKIIDIIEKRYLELYRQNRAAFLKEYFNFNFSGDEAIENIEHLLDSFCYLHGYASLSNLYGKTRNILGDHLERPKNFLYTTNTVYTYKTEILG